MERLQHQEVQVQEQVLLEQIQLLVQLHPPVVEVEVVVQIVVRLGVLVRLVVQVVELDGRLLLEELLEQEIHLQQLLPKDKMVEVLQQVVQLMAAVAVVVLVK